MNPKEYADHFQHAAAAGERLVRIHFTFIPPGETPGEIDAGMLQTWNAILDAAERNGLAVLPVLGVGGFGCDGWSALFDFGRTVAPSWDGKYFRNSIW